MPDPMLLALAGPVLALSSSLLGIATRGALARWLVFSALAASALSACAAGVSVVLSATPVYVELPLGLPWQPWHLGVDPLSGFFLALLGVVLLPVSLFGPNYARGLMDKPGSGAALFGFTGMFVAGMQLVVIADDALMFMVSWELMSLGSYFLVAYEHHHAENRRAAFLYLLMAHIGALSILVAFALLAHSGGGLTFDAMRSAPVSGPSGALAFLLALLGFGMKAGLVPVHAWLPEAHPAAPSHVSALMSGVMLKVAVYGFVRFCFDLMPAAHWSWGLVTLAVGAASALLGVLHALMQHDLKRLLAYHSVENIGIIFMGLGLALLFFAEGAPMAAALGLVAGLFHTLNHAVFKSLLFLGAGGMIRAAHERDLENMGGLMRRMPWTAGFFLMGCAAISALPPLNGFASEWLTFQTFLQVNVLGSGALRAVLPVAAAVLALTGALAAACFVKVFGVAFLGQPRSRHVRRARESSFSMLLAQGLLAALCALLGVFAVPLVASLGPVTRQLLGVELPNATANGWLWLTPVSADVAAYSPPLVLAGIALAGIAISITRQRQRRKHPARREPPWDCGFGGLEPSMQYSASGFSMPIRRVFSAVWQIDEHLAPGTEGEADPGRNRLGRYVLHVSDPAWRWLYEPFEHGVRWTARQASRLQTGRLRIYLVHSFLALLVLLWVIS